MIARRRPLRFLALVLVGWTGARIALLWPATGAASPVAVARADPTTGGEIDPPFDPTLSARDAARLLIPPLFAGGVPLPRLPFGPPPELSPREAPTAPRDVATRARADRLMTTPRPATMLAALAAPARPVAARPRGDPHAIALALAALVRFGPPLGPAWPTASRWSASSWLVARGGAATPFAPQLGGSQAGGRVAYTLDEGGRLALAGRFSTALGQRQREAAFGFEWRPTAVPLRIVAEQRVALDGGRGGPALGLVGGVDRVPLAGGLTLSGYGQAGGIARRGIEGFADGALRAGRELARSGPVTLDLSLGAWGAAQRGARRLDLGPSLGVALPAAGGTMRVALDWRQRIAGNAGPAAGPALSIGADF